MIFAHEINIQELQHPAEHLTDNYQKGEESGNYKLLDLSHREQKEIMRTLRLIEAWRDMDSAEGFTLDKIGKNVLELREGRADPEYRKAIKIKIRGNLSAGLVEDLNAICAILFESNFRSVSETWHQAAYNYEPAAVAIHLNNLAIGDELAFWRDLAFITEIVMAGGVGLYVGVRDEQDVGTYYAAAESSWLKEYVICEEAPLPTDAADYHAAAPDGWTREYIIVDDLPILTHTTDYHATALAGWTREYIIVDGLPILTDTIDYSAVAASEFTKEVVL